MSCPVCGLENCAGSCAPQPSAQDRVRRASLEAAERRQRQSPGDTLPDYEDEDEQDDDLEDEQSAP